MSNGTHVAKRTLVVYSHSYWPVRVSVADHIYSIARYSRNEVYYLNVIGGSVPRYLSSVKFDVIIYHTSLLSRRWDKAAFAKFTRLSSELAGMAAFRIALPQDEFINTETLEQWLLDAKVDAVCSVLKSSEWVKVYPRLVAQGAKFFQVLTGYLSDDFIALAKDAVRRTPTRSIDVGYRAWGAAAWLGRHGRLKVDIARRAQACAQRSNVVTDISIRNADSISGFSWLLFLARCRYVLGVEGGASIHDKDGSVRAATEAFVNLHSDATFEQIEAACFPGRDGELDCRALSPRHLEACATQTAQILVEGEYNGLLKPDLHYFSLKPDFSNLQDVFLRLGDEPRRLEVVERAYRDIVQSGSGSYKTFVGFLDDLPESDAAAAIGISKRSTSDTMRLAILRIHMKMLSWGIVIVWSAIGSIIRIARVFGRRTDSSAVIASARRIFRTAR